eukprot:CAMPEP_0195282004 /NCGR_PEP_ID=MMETSP0707-20130614/1078_1 /TAXON_ID=33640 /ORGANISM="Asterionellopsis glacialis, Strain CCMP134" /LENGTH=296 /DNA_ID=CAMNT_0040340953 /DNA_START=24 /DNA_END=914 /DNA_ORIENTATION=-
MAQSNCQRTTKRTSSLIDPSCERNRRPIDDPFFADGDRVAHGNESSTLAMFYFEDRFIETEMPEERDSENRISREFRFPCSACTETFGSISECEAHFEECHLFECHICASVFPSSFLLDLHLEEAHDSFFAAAVESRKARYRCLLPECPHSFDSKQGRLKHLRQQHGYPRWFRRFVPKSVGPVRITKSKNKKRGKGQKKIQFIQNPNFEEKKKPSQEADKASDEKKLRRRERQKAKRACTPCKFYEDEGGCRRGDSCMFLHDKSRLDADMDDLASQMKNKASITLPKNVSFGRRRR